MRQLVSAALVALAVAGPAAAEEPALTVTTRGSPIAPDSDPTPAVYRLEEEDLERAGLGLAEALASAPGVQVRRGGGSADLASASLRGGSSAQTPIYLAGVRLNDDLTGSVDLSTLPLWMLERVLVYRGHAPSSADDLGLGGAILLSPRLPSRVEAQAALGLGSFGEREGRARLSFGDGEGTGASVGLRHRAADGDFPFLDDNGTRFDTSDDVERRRRGGDHRELDVWALGRARLAGGGSLLTFANTFDRGAGAPGLALFGAERARVAQRRLLGGASAVVPCGLAGRCSLAFDLGALVTRYRLRDPLGEIGPAGESRTAGERVSQRSRVLLRVHDRVDLEAGVLLAEQWLRLDVDGTPTSRARRDRLRPEVSGLFRPHGDVTLAAVGALECQATRAAQAGDTCDLLEPVGRLGARYAPFEALAISANVGRYVRVPTLGELYGISATVLGNASLVSERGFAADLAISSAAELGPVDLWGQLVGYLQLASDLVAYRRSTFGAVRPYNAEAARMLGAELALGAVIDRYIEARLALSLLDPRDVSEATGGLSLAQNVLPFRARLVAAPTIGLRSPAWPKIGLDEASARLGLVHRASRAADPAGLVRLPAQTFLDLDLALAFLGHLALRMRLSNLLDQRTVDLIGYPLPGRAYHGLLETTW